MEITLEALGIKKEQLVEQIVDRAAVLALGWDDDNFSADLERAVKKKAQETMDARVQAIINEVATPKIEEMLRDLRMKETNRWGEDLSAEMSLREWLAKRVEDFLNLKVDWNGRMPDWASKATTTRLMYLIDSYLHSKVKTAIEQAIGNLDQAIQGGLETTVRVQLAELARTIKVDVNRKR